MSIKTKLVLAFGGLIVILVVVSVVTFHTLNESSKAIDRIMRENYDTIEYCYKMKDALERLDHLAEVSLWERLAEASRQNQEAIGEYERNLKFQQGNITVPGERELTERLTAQWQFYRQGLKDYYQLSVPGVSPRDYYRQTLLPRSQAVRETAQQILEANLNNMVAADGQAHHFHSIFDG